MTEREFGTCIGLLCAAVGKEMAEDQSAAWYAMLGDLSCDQLKAGIVATIRSYTFAGFPPIGIIRENCGAKSGVIAAKDRPTLAWEAVRRAIRKVGAYKSVHFHDENINAAIRSMGGWVTLCDATIEDLVWREKDFKSNYSALTTCDLPEEMTERLTGIIEKENGPAFTVPVAEVGCLTLGTYAITERREEPKAPEPTRIGTPLAAEQLAKRLTFDDRPDEQPKPPQRTKDEMLAALMEMTS